MKRVKKQYIPPIVSPLSEIAVYSNGESCGGGSAPATSSCVTGPGPETCIVGDFVGEAGH